MSDFLSDTNVVGVVIGLLISSQAVQLVNAFVESFVSPLIAFFFHRASEHVDDITLNVGGVQLRVANFLSALVRFVIVLVLVYLVYRANSRLIVKK
jgi:large-conductance mechanosensitive channel